MRDYELILIFNSEMEEETIGTSLEKIEGLVTQYGGVASNVDHWGKRRLAYPIKKLMEGNYVLVQFQMEPQQVSELEMKMKQNDEILRFLVVKS